MMLPSGVFRRMPSPALGMTKLCSVPLRTISSTRAALGQPRNMTSPDGKTSIRVVDQEESLSTVRKDLAQLIAEELEVKGAPTIYEQTAEETFLEKTRARVSDEGDRVTVEWRVDPYAVKVVFEKPTGIVSADENGLALDNIVDMGDEELNAIDVSPSNGKNAANARQEEEEEEEDDDEDADNENDEDENDEEENYEEDEDANEDEVAYDVMLTKDGAPHSLVLRCSSGPDNRLYVDLLVGQQGSASPVDFETLSEALQDRTYDLLDMVSVDDTLGLFMRRQYFKAKRLAMTSSLQTLLQNVELGAGEDVPKKKQGGGKDKGHKDNKDKGKKHN